MLITWDEPKRLANLRKHGFDFADFGEGFAFEIAMVRPAVPSATGRRRLMLIGEMGEEIVVAIVSPLGSEALSLVSLRRADAKERATYDEA